MLQATTFLRSYLIYKEEMIWKNDMQSFCWPHVAEKAFGQ